MNNFIANTITILYWLLNMILVNKLSCIAPNKTLALMARCSIYVLQSMGQIKQKTKNKIRLKQKREEGKKKGSERKKNEKRLQL